MPELKVSIDQNEQCIPYEGGDISRSLKDILDAEGITLPSDCGGVGKCGLCLVHIEAGECTPLSASEKTTLSGDELNRGCRLACQAKPLGDMSLSILKADNPAAWSELEADGVTGNASASNRLGLAIDLGTTQIRATLWNLDSKVRIDGITSLNPQAKFGADVLTRLAAAKATKLDADQLSLLASSAVGEAARILVSRHGLVTTAIRSISVVANTAMLALLAGKHYENLLEIEQWQKPVDCVPESIYAWQQAWGVATDAQINLVQPLAGFVGSDLLAGVLSTNLTGSEDAALLVDFGTNSEVALWDGQSLWVTSVPGGPAFEGSGLSCGVPMMEGAIYKISGHGADDSLELYVIGGAQAKGVCGSGLVDAIACLLSIKALNPIGRLAEPYAKAGFPLDETGSIRIRNHDIDLFQRAKGATGAAIVYLLEQAGLKQAALKRVCITGAFGSGLDCRNASQIGLIPDVDSEIIELYSDSALAGCEVLLVSAGGQQRLSSLREKARLINMSLAPEFDMLFVDNLFLKPLAKSGNSTTSMLE